jgi:beta-carotene hydroxylase
MSALMLSHPIPSTTHAAPGVRASQRQAGLPPLAELGNDLARPSRNWSVGYLLVAVLMLAGVAGLAMHGHYLLMVLPLFAAFIVLMTVTHDLVHGTAGFDRRQTDWLLFAISLAMLESAHAYRRTHLIHHVQLHGEADFEGAPARYGLLGALLHGPVYLPMLWLAGFRQAVSQRDRAWMIAEALTSIAQLATAILLQHISLAPLAYFAAVWLASWAYPFFTAYLPHRHGEQAPLAQTRTVRGRWLPRLLLNLPYHLEHHLYPQVPAHRLHKLAGRLDPHLAKAGVRPAQVW